MLAPSGKPAANKIGRDVCGCRTASRSIRASPPNVVDSGWFLTVCAASSAVASGCGVVFVMTAVGGEAESCVSSRLAAAVDRCWTIATKPATVSFSELMSAAKSICGLSVGGLWVDDAAADAGGELV